MARGMIKPLVAFYIGGMGTYYHAMFCRYGFQETADRVRELYNSGKRREATEAVSDELIDAIAICGPAAYCREQLQEWHRHGVGAALINLPTVCRERWWSSCCETWHRADSLPGAPRGRVSMRARLRPLGRHPETEARAASDLALHGDTAAEQIEQTAHDVESEPAAAVAARR